MARPVKRRRVCGLPPVGAFRPEGGPGGPVIEVTVAEYEAVRLIDLLGLTQEECGFDLTELLAEKEAQNAQNNS